MENPTAFDLNEAIRRWQKRLSDSPAFADGNLEELESHLRASIAALKAKGLSEEEAFLIALRRLGEQSAIEQEYAKINSGTVWLTRGIWMLVGIVALQVIGSLASTLSLAASILLHLWFPKLLHLAAGPVRAVTGLASEALLVALALKWLMGGRKDLRQWLHRRLSSPWQGAIGLLLVVVCMEMINTGCKYLFLRYANMHQETMSFIGWRYVNLLTTLIIPPVALGLLTSRRARQKQPAIPAR